MIVVVVFDLPLPTKKIFSIFLIFLFPSSFVVYITSNNNNNRKELRA